MFSNFIVIHVQENNGYCCIVLKQHYYIHCLHFFEENGAASIALHSFY